MEMLEDKNVTKIVEQIKENIKVAPEVGILLGSGWSDVAQKVENPIIIPYNTIKGMPICHVAGHNGNIIVGKLSGKNVMIMQGRFHYYEGYDARTVVLPVIIMHLLGVKKLLITNAAGAINTRLRPGNVVIIDDHINYSFNNPLIGIKDNTGKVYFSDMTEPYKLQWVEKIETLCRELDMDYLVGTYLQTSGPNYETPAEVKMFRTLGADVVGMSSVCEILMARYFDMECAGLSLVTNMGAGILDKPLTHEEVIKVADKNKSKLCTLVTQFISKI